ncbi:MAG: hypothetical protein HC848_01665, partial [Limnobacter sp.]|nr:hypothetical protein [Limnobacter sp.]
MRSHQEVDIHSKPYRQLLAFSLSALAVLPGASPSLLDDLVHEQLLVLGFPDVLDTQGCLQGRAGSGNQAMFVAIFLLHGRKHLGLDTQAHINTWTNQHLEHMNQFGFWGKASGITHLQFQNGYHQHEVLEYLGVENPRPDQNSLEAVSSLADTQGHFAPSPWRRRR